MSNFKNLIKFKKSNVVLFLGIGIVGVIAVGTVIMSTQGVASPIEPTEVISDRTLNSKIFDNGDKSFTLEAHVGHIHYLDKNTGKLEGINTDVVETLNGWGMGKAGYEVELPQTSAGQIKFFVNKFDKDIYSVLQGDVGELVKQASFQGQDNIDFTLTKIAGQSIEGVQGIKTDHHQITYPEIVDGIDLVLSTGSNSFRKEVVIKQKPSGTDDLIIEFATNQNFVKKTKARFQEKSIHFREAKVWDSSPNTQVLSIELDFSVGKLIKRIPREFLEKAIYPIRTDTITSYYAGSGQDASIYQEDADWDIMHDATSGNIEDVSGEVKIGIYISSYYAHRAFFPIDSSALPDATTIAAATFSLYPHAVYDEDGDANSWMNIVQTSQASSTQLVAGDFDQCGAINNPTEGATRIDISNIATSTYNTWTLNATGLGWISKTGYSLIGMREGHDILDDIPSGRSQIYVYPSEYDGNDPYLSVTYAITLEARKSIDESYAQTLLQNDDELILALEANKTYIIDGVIFAGSTSNTPDIKIAFDTPDGAAWITDIGFIAASSAFRYAEMLEGDKATSSTIAITADVPIVIQVSGTVKTDGTGGNLGLFWAQANSNPADVTVKVGGYLRADEI